MGLAQSEPAKPPPVILVPPKFYRDHFDSQRLFNSPIETVLSSVDRRRLFYWQAEGIAARAVLQPPNDGKVQLHASIYNGALNHVREDVAARLAVRFTPDPAQPGQMVEILTHVATEGLMPPMLRGSLVLRPTWFDRILANIAGKGPSSYDGPASPRLFRSQVAIAGATPLQPTTGDVLAGATDAASAHLATPAALPYFGAQFLTAYGADSRYQVGCGFASMGVSNTASEQFKYWSYLRAGAWYAAAQQIVHEPLRKSLSDPSERYLAEDRSYLIGYKGAGYELFYHATGLPGFYTLGFLSHQVIRRQCRNPLEREGVAGIANTVDVGIQVRSNGPKQQALECAGAWQINKNWLLRGLVSSDGTAGLGVSLRSWSQPSFIVSMQLTTDAKSFGSRIVSNEDVVLTSSGAAGAGAGSRGKRRVNNNDQSFHLPLSYGLSIAIENCGEISFERPSANTVFSTPTLETHASATEMRDGVRPLVLSPAEVESRSDRASFSLTTPMPRDRGMLF